MLRSTGTVCSVLRSTGTVFCSLLYLNSRRGFNGVNYMYSVISVIVDSLPGNTKNRESTRSWTARVRLVHSWAALVQWLQGILHPRKKERKWVICFLNEHGIQFARYFIKFIVVETKQFVGSNVNVILTWQTCSQRSSCGKQTPSARKLFFQRIRHMFWSGLPKKNGVRT